MNTLTAIDNDFATFFEQTDSKLKQSLQSPKEIKQSRNLNLSCYKLSALALDILNLFLAQIFKNDTDIYEYKVSIVQLQKALGKQIDRERLEDIGKELMGNPIRLVNFDGSIGMYHWCSEVVYHPKEYWISLKISEGLKQHLIGVGKNFGLWKFDQFVKLQSSYAKRLYSILKQHENLGKFWGYIDQLQNIFQTGDIYPRYSDFKKRVILHAINDINSHTDLRVELNEEKAGRKVHKLIFRLQKKSETGKEQSNQFSENSKKKSGVTAAENWLNLDNVIEGELC
jgi:plasmid replication initiation protein